MPSPSDPRLGSQPPRFENLEERLLLTTLYEGQSFIYCDSNGDGVSVRVNLYDSDPDVTAACELTTLYTYTDEDGNPQTVFTDVPGFYFDPELGTVPDMVLASPYQLWPDDQPVFEWTDDGWVHWQHVQEGVRGAEAEIWAIYFSASSDSTILTIAEMEHEDLPTSAEEHAAWMNDVDQIAGWDAEAIIAWSSQAQGEGGAIYAPDSSGGVIVGAEVYQITEDEVDYVAVPDDQVQSFGRLGVFPGGNLRPGITIGGDGFQEHIGADDFGVGQAVQAIATSSSGQISVVDSGAFIPWMEGAQSSFSSGSLGKTVNSLAADSSGRLWGANNAANVHVFAPDVAPGGVQSIASDGIGNSYLVEESTHHLIRVDSAGATTIIGQLRDAGSPSVLYENVSGLDFNPVDGALYGVGTMAGAISGQQFLLIIDPASAAVVSKVQLDSDIDAVRALAFAQDGTLYAAGDVGGGNNRLMTIDTSTGVATDLAGLSISSDVVGLDFIGDTLYGVTAGDASGPTGAELYVINTTTGVGTRIAVLDGYGLAGLAFDASTPGALITAVASSEYDSGSGVARIPLGAMMAYSTREGSTTWGSCLYDHDDPTVVYTNVAGLDYNSGGVLYGVAQKVQLDPYDTSDTSWYIITIDEWTGSVTSSVAIQPSIELASIAFDASDNLYGITAMGGVLFTIDPDTGQIASVGNTGIMFPKGMIFVDDALYVVDPGKLYAVNPSTAAVTQLADTGRTDLTALASDPAIDGLLWVVGIDTPSSYSRAMRLPLSAELNSSTDRSVATRIGLILDSEQPGWSYTDVLGLDYDSNDTLYAVGSVLDVRPYDGGPTPSSGQYLLKINTRTGVATRIAPLSGDVTSLASIAFDKDDVLYGISDDTAPSQVLVTVDKATGQTHQVGTVATPKKIVGIEFAGALDTLYAITTDSGPGNFAQLYAIDPSTATPTLLWEITDPFGTRGLADVTGLAEDPDDPERLLTAFVDHSPSTPEGDVQVYYLGDFVTDPAKQGHDFGRAHIMGTLAGAFYTTKSVDLIELGFLYGNVIIGNNLGDLTCRMGAGAVHDTNWAETPDRFRNIIAPDYVDDGTGTNPSSMIRVGGSVRTIDFRGLIDRTTWSYTGVEVGGNPNAPLPSQVIYEREYGIEGLDAREIEAGFGQGLMTYGAGDWYGNDRPEHAQFLSHPTGEFWLDGALEREFASDAPDGMAYAQDWYALPLMAGQTVMIDGTLEYPGMHVRLYDSGTYWGPGFTPDDPHMLIMDSYGYETYEDEAIHSTGSTLKPLVFTAPAAGIYYVVVGAEGLAGSIGAYQLHFLNATDEGLGGLNVLGQYWPADGNYGTMSGQDTSFANISAKNGAGIGGIMIWGRSLETNVYSAGGGDMVCLQAAAVGGWTVGTLRTSLPGLVYSDSNIGRVAATDWENLQEGWIVEEIVAGYHGGVYNHNAHIQNIYAASDIYVDNQFSATGSIGVIEAPGVLASLLNTQPSGIVVNSDYDLGRAMAGEPAGNIDLIQVGNFGGGSLFSPGLLDAPPMLFTAPGGDVKYVCVIGQDDVPGVDGRVYEWVMNDYRQVNPTIVYGGQSAVIQDDSGGHLKIAPTPVPVDLVNNNDPTDLTPDGIQDLDPVTWLPLWWYPNIAYLGIAVNDLYQGGVGYALARVQIDGPATFNTTGVVGIGELDISHEWYDPNNLALSRPAQMNLRFTGSGETFIYYLHDDPNDASFNPQTLRMTDAGASGKLHLLSGHLYYTGVDEIRMAGNLGDIRGGTTGAWLHGHDDAPIVPISNASAHDTQVQYGWYHRKINGLWVESGNRTDPVTGDVIPALASLRVGGSLRDVRVDGGAIGTIVVDFDGVTYPDRWDSWDGIEGVVWSNSRIEAVYVGDGLADDGGAYAPEAGIFSSGTIGAVYIEGPWYQVAPPSDADVNEQLRYQHYYNRTGRVTNYRTYGELNGSIIAANVNPTLTVDPYDIAFPVDEAIRLVRGTNGAKCTALILGMDLDAWSQLTYWIDNVYIGTTGHIGTVDFSGPGAEIYGSEIRGWYVNKVQTSADSEGIFHSHIRAENFFPGYRNRPLIGQVLAGGRGLHYSSVEATGGDIGTVKGIGPVADLTNTLFTSTQDLAYLGARDISRNNISIPGKIDTIHAARDMEDNRLSSYGSLEMGGIAAGAIGNLTVGRDFTGSDLRVAGELTSMVVGGDFLNSSISMYGATKAYLKSLVVSGDISGKIVSHGSIGQIISKNGTIYADITTVPHSVDSNLALIQAAGGIKGDMDIAGDVGRIISYSSLGDNPAMTAGQTQLFNIWGDLDYLRVAAPKGSTADLYADVYVGGNIGTIDVDGTLYSNVRTNGNLKNLMLDGALGGTLGGGVGDRGSLTVFGTIGKMKFNTGADLVADLSIGGSIGKIQLRGADIRGNIESRFGSIKQIDVNGGSILGTITGKSIGKVRVVGGNVAGDVTTTNGDIGRLQIQNGDLNANVTAAGRLEQLDIINGDASAGFTITGEQGIGRIRIRGGDLDADVVSGAGIGQIDVTGSDISGMINAAVGIGKLRADGTIANTSIRAGGSIGSLDAGRLLNTTVSSAWNIGKVQVKGDLVGSRIYAGYDVGDDGAVGGGDDNPLNGGVVHSGSIGMLNVLGALDGSVVLAGIDPTDGSEAGGVSNISKATVRGGYRNVGSARVQADTYIDSKFAAEAAAAGVTVVSGVTYVPDTTGAFPFGPASPIGKTLVLGGLSMTLTSGTGYYRPMTDELILVGTNSRSSLTINNSGLARQITILTADDSGLANLKVQGNVTIGDVSIDGSVRNLDVPTVADGSTWQLPGGVQNAKLTSLDGVDVTAGYVQNWQVSGSYSSGEFTADAVKQFYVFGSAGADVSSILGGFDKLRVQGNYDGVMTARGTVKMLDIQGALSGDVVVTHGDLTTARFGTGLSGSVNVQRGLVKQAQVKSGDFGGTDETSFRAARGILKFDVRSGDLEGLLSTRGDLRNLNVSRGDLSGRVWSGGSIRSVKLGRVDEGLLSASGDIWKVNIVGDMYGGWILAGFDPGDAGYDPANGGEAANLMLDGFTNDSWKNAENADQASGGMIKQVNIGGDMGRTYQASWGSYRYSGATIAAGIDPGTDAYVGTGDDLVASTGYVGIVRVKGGIYGSGTVDESYGVYAASNIPAVYHHTNQPFLSSYNASVGSMVGQASTLRVTDVVVGTNYIMVTLNATLNAETINEDSFTVIASVDTDFGTLGDNTNISTDVANTISYSTDNYYTYVVLTLAGAQTWSSIGCGQNLQLIIDSSIVSDNRGNALDGEFSGVLPSGDGVPGGDFVWSTVAVEDVADTFDDAIDVAALTLPMDGGVQLLASAFDDYSDVDIFRFSANAYEYFSAQFFGSALAEMCLFYRDTQGTAEVADDTFEAVARYEYQTISLDTLFEAFELPRTGEYYLAVAPLDLSDGTSYRLAMTLASSDANLLSDLGGELPHGEEIAYVSNFVGEHNNLLGANTPKQLVYLNFNGGTATKYAEYLGGDVSVAPFDLRYIDQTLDGYENVLINGGTVDGQVITGIVDNVLDVYRNTPASHPQGQLNVQLIDVTDATDWASYLAADEGVFFTTVDPALRGLNPETDFTTAFIGNVDASLTSPGALGLASEIDVANQTKADNALIYAQNFGYYSQYMPGFSTADKLNGFSHALAGTIAHELGHTFGLNHQPTDFTNYWLMPDDPDNDPSTLNDSNTGVALMAYIDDSVSIERVWELGTARLTPNEFPVGYLDTADLMVMWLS